VTTDGFASWALSKKRSDKEGEYENGE